MKKIVSLILLFTIVLGIANCASNSGDDAAESAVESPTLDSATKIEVVPQPVTATAPTEPPPSEPVTDSCLTTQLGECPDQADVSGTPGFHTSNGF